jgi:hypothetical protein
VMSHEPCDIGVVFNHEYRGIHETIVVGERDYRELCNCRLTNSTAANC